MCGVQHGVDEKENFPSAAQSLKSLTCVKPLYILGCISYGCIWIFGHGNEKKYVVFIHHISVKTVHIHAVVQVYTELSKHLKNMKTSIHFHLTKSRIHLIFSKTNTRMPPNRHSNICSSIWLASPIGRWGGAEERTLSLAILKMRDDGGRAGPCCPVMQNVNCLTHREHYSIAPTSDLSYWTTIKYK